MVLQEHACFFDGVGNGGGDIAPNIGEDLLQDSGVQSCACDANLVQFFPVRNRVFDQGYALACRETSANDQTDPASVSFQVHHQLAQLTHPHAACGGFLRTKEASPEGHNMRRAHDLCASRPCFHPIP